MDFQRRKLNFPSDKKGSKMRETEQKREMKPKLQKNVFFSDFLLGICNFDRKKGRGKIVHLIPLSFSKTGNFFITLSVSKQPSQTVKGSFLPFSLSLLANESCKTYFPSHQFYTSLLTNVDCFLCPSSCIRGCLLSQLTFT